MAHQLQLKTASLPAATDGALVLYVSEGGRPEGAAAAIWAATRLDWDRAAGATGFKGKQGQVLDIVSPSGLDANRLLVLGAGKPADSGESPTAWADRGGSLAGKLVGLRVAKASIVLDSPDATPERVAELAAGMRLRHYRFDRYKSRKPENEGAEAEKLVVTLHVASKAAADRAIEARMPAVDGTLLARDLVNEPANVLGTEEFAAARGEARRPRRPRRGAGRTAARKARHERAAGRRAGLCPPAAARRHAVAGRPQGHRADRLRRQGRRLRYRRYLDQAGRQHGRHEGRHGRRRRRHRADADASAAQAPR